MARKKALPEEAMEAAVEDEAVQENQAEATPEQQPAQPPLLLAEGETVLTEENADEIPDTEPEQPQADASEPEPELPPVKTTRRRTAKKAEPAEEPSSEEHDTDAEADAEPEDTPARRTRPRKSILTIEAGDTIESPEEQDEIAWHEIQNAYRSKKILTGTLGGVERTNNKNNVCVIYYKNIRVTIPYSEMMIKISEEQSGYGDLSERVDKIINNMLGADIDFIVHGLDRESRAVVASRKSAMLKKRERYYFRPDAATGLSQVHEGRIVQARIIATTPVAARVDIFGIEVSIRAADLSWDWIGNVQEKYYVGDRILVRILSVSGETPETLTVKADGKSVYPNAAKNNLSKCNVQGKYVGKVTNINKGAVYIQLANGVSAVAHTCFDPRTPGRKDEVGFVVTHIDTTHNMAVGIITRIIKQHI